MTSAQCLQPKKLFLVQEQAVVYLLLFFLEVSNIFFFQVPVVLIFTKFDALEDMCYNKLRSQGKNHQEAEDLTHESANKIFQNEYLSRVLTTDFPPKTYIHLTGDILSPYKFFEF